MDKVDFKKVEGYQQFSGDGQVKLGLELRPGPGSTSAMGGTGAIVFRSISLNLSQFVGRMEIIPW
jgi:hypothetical protein